jgi:hypothetical protein
MYQSAFDRFSSSLRADRSSTTAESEGERRGRKRKEGETVKHEAEARPALVALDPFVAARYRARVRSSVNRQEEPTASTDKLATSVGVLPRGAHSAIFVVAGEGPATPEEARVPASPRAAALDALADAWIPPPVAADADDDVSDAETAALLVALAELHASLQAQLRLHREALADLGPSLGTTAILRLLSGSSSSLLARE